MNNDIYNMIEKEWKPNEDTIAWIEKKGYWKYNSSILKMTPIEYVIDNELKEKMKTYKYIEKKENSEKYKILKIYKIYNDKVMSIATTTCEILASVSMYYNNYIKSSGIKHTTTYFDAFDMEQKINIKMLYCYKFEGSQNKIITNNLKSNIYLNNINYYEEIFNIYFSMLDNICKNNNMNKRKYYFYQDGENFGFTKDKKKKNKNYVLEEEYRSDTEAKLKIELLRNDDIEYKIYDNKINGITIAKLKEKLTNLINVERLLTDKNDYSQEEYEKIKCIIVAIIVDKKYIFVDNVKNITVSDYISNLFLEKIEGRLKNISKLIKKSDVDKINIEYCNVILKSDKVKISNIQYDIVKNYKKNKSLIFI